MNNLSIRIILNDKGIKAENGIEAIIIHRVNHIEKDSHDEIHFVHTNHDPEGKIYINTRSIHSEYIKRIEVLI
jgi:hypothetical protein